MPEVTPSIWEEESFRKQIDLLVIGAGITGCSAALFWKQRHPDDRVVVVDRGLLPEGASTRNAGFACIGSMSEHLDDMRQTDEETVLQRIGRRWNGLKLLRQTLGDDPIGYEACGGYEIFPDEDSTLFESCLSKVEWMNRKLEDITGEKDVYQACEYQDYSAIYNRLEGAVHTGKMMAALLDRVTAAGIPVWWNFHVKHADGNGVELAGGQTFSSGRVLAATNGFTKQITDLPVEPARGMIIKTRPIPGHPWHGTFSCNKGYVYFRHLEDGSLLLGGARDIDMQTETTDVFGINPKIKQWLTGFADNVLKLPSDWEIEREWSGIMGFTPDKEPLITLTESGLYVAAGLSGMGVAIGMQVAREAMELMG